jgi:CubicO group peptidase (beta-lactamase class C family)
MNKVALTLVLTAVQAGAQLPTATPASVGMSAEGLQRAAGLIDAEMKDKSGAAAIIVARRGKVVLHKGFGKMSTAADAAAVKPDSIFLLASITKPVTACALMLLVERGLVSLSEPVSRYLPEFTGEGRANVRVRDLLSHTSGLPDMLPENTALRRAHAPLSGFVAGALKTPLLYPPREDFKYQSMGILLAAEIVERVTKMKLRDFEQKEIFGPLGMRNSALGMKPEWKIEETVLVWESPKSAASKDGISFGANSPYWRDMGHPWGGMHSTTTDLAILLQAFLNGGKHGGKRWMSPASVMAMTTNQNTHLKHPWGLGWAMAHSTVWTYSGDLVSANTFGHAGATGTVAWADPERQLLCVVLTNRSISFDDGRLLRLVSNAVVAAVEDGAAAR